MYPFIYGELDLKPWEAGDCTPAEILLMIDGWKKRYYHLEDLFINWVAYPQYCIASPKKPPNIKLFYKHRKPNEAKEILERIKKDFKI